MNTASRFRRSVFFSCVAFCCVWLCLSFTAFSTTLGDLVIGQFTGTVQHITVDTANAFPELSIGSTVVGTFAYESDPNAYDSITGSNPTRYIDTFPDNGFFAWEVTILGTTRTMANAMAQGTGGDPFISVNNSGFNPDSFFYLGRVTSLTHQFTELLALVLDDATQTVFDNNLPPGSLELADFDSSSFGSMEISLQSNSTAFNFSFDSFSAHSVPEPSMAIMGLVGCCVVVSRRRRNGLGRHRD